jgi:hypothetical protein
MLLQRLYHFAAAQRIEEYCSQWCHKTWRKSSKLFSNQAGYNGETAAKLLTVGEQTFSPSPRVVVCIEIFICVCAFALLCLAAQTKFASQRI